MTRTQRSPVSLFVIALSALVLVGCGGDDQVAGSDGSTRRQAFFGLDARICVANDTGEPLSVSFNDRSNAPAPQRPLGEDLECNTDQLLKGSTFARVRNGGGRTVFSLQAVNDDIGYPKLILGVPSNGDTVLVTKRFEEGDAHIWDREEGSPYRVEALRLTDSTTAKEFVVHIYR